MKVFFDTTVLVELDRQRPPTVSLLEAATKQELELWISTVTVSEILLGAYLRRDYARAALRAREALGRFAWQDLDGTAADYAAKLLAELYAAGQPVEYQDAAIAGCALAARADALVTENKGHFARFGALRDNVYTVREFAAKLEPT